MNAYIEPVTCLDFEPEAARSLVWLPLAVRHKLDGAGLKISLEQWQSLSMDARLRLLQLSSAQGFCEAAVEAGAYSVATLERQTSMSEAEAAQMLKCAHSEANRWLAASTSFARYALRKRERNCCTVS